MRSKGEGKGEIDRSIDALGKTDSFTERKSTREVLVPEATTFPLAGESEHRFCKRLVDLLAC